MRHSTVDTRQN